MAQKNSTFKNFGNVKITLDSSSNWNALVLKIDRFVLRSLKTVAGNALDFLIKIIFHQHFREDSLVVCRKVRRKLPSKSAKSSYTTKPTASPV